MPSSIAYALVIFLEIHEQKRIIKDMLSRRLDLFRYSVLATKAPLTPNTFDTKRLARYIHNL